MEPVCDKQNNPLKRSKLISIQLGHGSVETFWNKFSCTSSSYVNVWLAERKEPRSLNMYDKLRQRSNTVLGWFLLHHSFFLFLDRCKWMWSLPAWPRRKAVHLRVCKCSRFIPLLVSQRVQVAPWWAELWGWVTRVNRGQRLIHGALDVDLAGYVTPERNSCDLEKQGSFFAAELLVLQRWLSASYLTSTDLHHWSLQCVPVEWMTSPFPSRRDL